jgi:predicted Zn-dependent protease
LQFFFVDLPDANAFVLPGGRVYVSRKLIALAQNEDELASVISHELGHLAARETAIEMTRRFKQVLGVTAVSDRRDVFERYNQLIDNVMRKPGAFKERDREKGQLVADQIGFNALVNAGYDPKAAAGFWDRVNEVKGKTGSWFSDLFGTTRPEQRRLREMLNALSSLPPGCIQERTASASEQFKQWQAAVVAYTGSGRNESLRHVVTKLNCRRRYEATSRISSSVPTENTCWSKTSRASTF